MGPKGMIVQKKSPPTGKKQQHRWGKSFGGGIKEPSDENDPAA